SGHMKAVSVGFLPLEWEDKFEDDGSRVRTYTRVELLEISCVAVPSNRDALVRSARAGNSFVDQKRSERAERKLLAEIEAEFPDEVCQEFVDALLGDDYEIDDDDGGECDFAGIVSQAEPETDQVVAGVLRDCDDFASMVRGDASGDSITGGKRREAASRFDESIPFDC
ncbi:MAG: HK97 family phage prohead protease, partial [Sedimentisphaerales bacterium]|nr:HK97 family phage prohead protease [Sedimentisphaerales bacterium]